MVACCYRQQGYFRSRHDIGLVLEKTHEIISFTLLPTEVAHGILMEAVKVILVDSCTVCCAVKRQRSWRNTCSIVTLCFYWCSLYVLWSVHNNYIRVLSVDVAKSASALRCASSCCRYLLLQFFCFLTIVFNWRDNWSARSVVCD